MPKKGIGINEMGLVLHSFRRCPYAIRVRMALVEKGLPFELREEDLSRPSAELLRIHPEGRVPVLVRGAFVLPESAQITRYLEREFPEPSLLPSHRSDAWAEIDEWTRWCDEGLKPDLDAFKYDWPELAEPDRLALQTRLGSRLAQLESVVSPQAFLFGAEFTLADIHVFPFLRQLTRARPELFRTQFRVPKIEAWLERIYARPSFGKVMEKMSVNLKG